jgi:GDP-L-fucose synthase
LVPNLRERGFAVTVLAGSRMCDLTRRENLESVPEHGFDRIYHLAAWTKAGEFALHHPGEQWILNQQLNTNVVWYWREREPQATLIVMGTSCAYAPGAELREENYMVGEPDPGLYTYAMTKRMLYQGVRSLHQQYGMNYCCFVPSTLYGPGFDSDDSHFIFDLVRKIVRGKYRGDPVVLWGDGSQIRELIHVRDAVRLIESAVDERQNELLNLGSGVGYSIRDFAEIVCQVVGFDVESIRFDTDRYVGVHAKVLNTERLLARTDFAFEDLRSGIAEVVDDYVKRFETPAARN